MRRLKSGNLIFVKNGPIDKNTGRSQMTAFLSRDDGKTWEGGLLLDERNAVSYPDGDQMPDGTIFIVYDFSRYGAKEIYAARITEADILAKKIVTEGSQLKILVNKATGIHVKPELDKPALRANADGKPMVTVPAAEMKPILDGVIYRRSEIGFGMIRDGSSNMYLIGEKYLCTQHYEISSDGNNESNYFGCTDDHQRGAYYVPCQDRDGYPNAGAFGSSHAGTFGMTMCDGSVQRISYSIDKETHKNLASRNDGKNVSLAE